MSFSADIVTSSAAEVASLGAGESSFRKFRVEFAGASLAGAVGLLEARGLGTGKNRLMEKPNLHKPNFVTLSSSLAGRRPVRDQILLHYPACNQLASRSVTSSRAGVADLLASKIA